MKIIDIEAVKQDKPNWHADRKFTKAEMDNMSWEQREEIIDRTIMTIPIATPQMWADFSGVDEKTFMQWKYRIDMSKYGRVLKSNMGHNI